MYCSLAGDRELSYRDTSDPPHLKIKAFQELRSKELKDSIIFVCVEKV